MSERSDVGNAAVSEEREMLVGAVSQLMGDLCTPEDVRGAERTGWAPSLWAALCESGFAAVGVAEAAGGSGGDVADACALLEVAGAYAAPVPMAETGMLGGWALASAGLPLPAGAVTVAPGHRDDEVRLERRSGTWRLRCRIHRVPWASESEVVVVLARLDGRPDGPLHVVALPRGSFETQAGHNLAGEPREVVTFDGSVGAESVAAAPEGLDEQAMSLRGALSRCALLCGAMSRISTLTGRYTHERQQFGRPIARFQAVQHHLVRIAEQTQAARTATTAAAHNSVARLDLFDIAAAKTVAGDAAVIVAAAAHQAHGAMGMTREYELAQLTRRLWSWRDEYHNEAYWSRLLGQQVIAQGADALWPRVSTGRVA